MTVKKMSDKTADDLIGPYTPPTGNDFDADMYELEKLRQSIYAALDTAEVGARFAFVAKELDDTSQLMFDPAVDALEFTLPCPSWEEA